MKKLIRLILGLVLVAGVLALLKPSAKDFESWLQENSAKQRSNAKGENVVEKLVDKGVTTATQLQVLATYQYTDHKVIAVVEANANGEKYRYVGLATTWVKLP